MEDLFNLNAELEEFQIFLKKIKNDEFFSLLSYGDGEWYFIFDGKPVYHPREYFLPTMKEELKRSLRFSEEKDVYLTSTTKGCPEYEKKVKDLLRNFKWKKEISNARFLYEFLCELGNNKNINAENIFKELINTINTKSLVLIGEPALRKVKLNYNKFIETLSYAAFSEKIRIEEEILNYGKPAIYAFSVGIVSNILITDLHDKLKDSFLIDFGALWGLLFGLGTRKIGKWDYPIITL